METDANHLNRSTKYKIAIVCDWYLPRIGGLEVHIHDLANELAKHGHEAHIICTTQNPGTFQESKNITVHRLNVPLFPRFLYPRMEMIRSRQPSASLLEKLFLKENFDVIHCHTLISSLSHVALLVAKKLSIPSVLTEHSVLDGAAAACFRSVKPLYPWHQIPTVLTAVSQFLAREFYKFARRKIYVIHNGIDLNEWVSPQPSQKRFVSSIMRFTRRKRPIEIVRAIPRIFQKLPANLRPQFALLGDGKERPRVEREAVRLGVQSHVDLLGFQPREVIKKTLAESMLFILPTIKESLSIASLQALAAGVPVVAMNHGGVGEVLQHGYEGYLANTTEEFIEYIVRILGDEALRRQMAENSKKRLHRFSWDKIIPDHARIYDLALQHHRVPVLEGESLSLSNQGELMDRQGDLLSSVG